MWIELFDNGPVAAPGSNFKFKFQTIFIKSKGITGGGG